MKDAQISNANFLMSVPLHISESLLSIGQLRISIMFYFENLIKWMGEISVNLACFPAFFFHL